MSSWLQSLRIQGQEVVDALGQGGALVVEDGATYLERGRLWLEGDVLYRSGRSGAVLTFVREPQRCRGGAC